MTATMMTYQKACSKALRVRPHDAVPRGAPVVWAAPMYSLPGDYGHDGPSLLSFGHAPPRDSIATPLTPSTPSLSLTHPSLSTTAHRAAGPPHVTWPCGSWVLSTPSWHGQRRSEVPSTLPRKCPGEVQEWRASTPTSHGFRQVYTYESSNPESLQSFFDQHAAYHSSSKPSLLLDFEQNSFAKDQPSATQTTTTTTTSSTL